MENSVIIDFQHFKRKRMPPCIQEALDYLEDHFCEKISIEELAENLFISKSYLMHEFKRVQGKGIHQYMTEKRIAYAVELMRSGKSIQESSELAGYEDYSLFYRNFQKQTGLSPRQFQQEQTGSVGHQRGVYWQQEPMQN